MHSEEWSYQKDSMNSTHSDYSNIKRDNLSLLKIYSPNASFIFKSYSKFSNKIE